MSNYNFTTLSSYDFEHLVRDLLQDELTITLQTFKQGRDGGIDLRYSRSKEGEIIVQCKHFAGSHFSNLISELKNIELPKIRILNPQRYILATSLGLSPQNKNTIISALHPFIRAADDIYGCDDLNNLLGKFPLIEKRNFKLWYSSTAILESLIHSGVVNRSQIELEHILRKVKIYVQNKSLPEAYNILEDQHYCIIAGIPGIGKTTLAEMLILDFMRRGFDLVRISNRVEEGLRVLNRNQRQIFYYDDFLGKTTLEQKLDKNEDVELIRFCEAMKKSSGHRFIMTTREYILNQAKAIHESLSHSNIDFKKCTIELSSYSEYDKAKILYNHVFFSDLKINHKEDLLRDRAYRKIIGHKNYSPRIIEWMTDNAKTSLGEDDDFVREFLSNLDNPEQIWSHAFEFQLTDAARSILLVMTTLPDEVLLDDLERAFAAFHGSASGQQDRSLSFIKNIKQLEGTFIHLIRIDSTITVNFHNPSIKDFLDRYLVSHEGEIKALCNHAVFFEQLQRISQITTKQNKQWIERNKVLLLSKMMKCLQSENPMLSTQHVVNKGSVSVAKNRMSSNVEVRIVNILKIIGQENYDEHPSITSQLIDYVSDYVQLKTTSKASLMNLIRQIPGNLLQLMDDKFNLLAFVKLALLKDLYFLSDYEYVVEFEGQYPHMFTSDEAISIKNEFEDAYYSMVREVLRDEEDPDEIREQQEKLETIANSLGVDVSSIQHQIEDRIGELEASQHDDIIMDEGHLSYGTNPTVDTTAEIDSMFDTLR